MKIGVPKEIKNHEYRVSLVPAGAKALIDRGHTVSVEKGAGLGSAITDSDYEAVGARIVDDVEEVWGTSDLIMKVKEPLPPEYDRIQRGQTLYTYFHLAAVPELAPVLLQKEVTAVAYETIQLPDGRLPLLEPMSEVAGRLSIQAGARCLERQFGGKGQLLGGVPGVDRGDVVIIGGGVVGTNAAKMAVGLGARVWVLDINLARLSYLDDIFGNRITTLHSNHTNLRNTLARADLVVGAVLIAGARAPKLVTEDDLKLMQDGSVVVDVSVDQGGCIETARATTHENPTYELHGIVHYCVANMPGAVARTSTFALTNTTIGYGLKIADVGIEKAALSDKSLGLGVNTFRGTITHKQVATSLGYDYMPTFSGN